MFKVESTGVSQAPSALSLNSQSNFDFELSFCDDGTTDDLFDTFTTTEAPERNNGSSSSGSVVGSSNSPMEAVATTNRSDATAHIKIEQEDGDVNMASISSDLASENSPSVVSSAVCSSAIDPVSSPVVVQPQDTLRPHVGENGPSDSTTPSPTNPSSNSVTGGGNVSASGTTVKKGKLLTWVMS